MERRQFLKNSAKGLVGASILQVGAVGLSSCNHESSEIPTNEAKWKNWSGLQSCNPKQIIFPKDENEVADTLKKAKQIRLVGSGHSFMPLVPNDFAIMSLDQISGVVSHNPEKITATIKGGSKIFYINRELNKINQAIYSLPDVDYQSIAGSISTATHGTGINYGAIHSYLTALKLITPQGELIECSETKNPDIFQAAKVSLGALGAITEVTLQNRPKYLLHRILKFQPLEYILEKGTSLFEGYEHFEIYYIPHSGYCLTVQHSKYSGELKPRDKSTDEDSLADLKMVRDFLSWSPIIRKNVLQLLMKPGQIVEEAIDESWRLLSQPRVTKFNESEYHVDRSQGMACFEKVCRKIDTIKETYFPIEFRLIKGDDAWLSPFNGHNHSHSIAIHSDSKERYKYLINEFGPIFKAHGGRPHWGKLNDLTQQNFKELYPKWDDFNAIRKTLDPQGKMLNPYLKSVFES